jgi:hypothetical protein
LLKRYVNDLAAVADNEIIGNADTQTTRLGWNLTVVMFGQGKTLKASREIACGN